ncbi:MAG: TolC family protein [Calditrichaeota bacterium]|nr:MAG: TolC family protein [Calditrichota bacterium]
MAKLFRIGLSGLALVVLWVHTGLAQDGHALSLQECIEIALKNNSDFKTANYQVDRAGANVLGSYSAILPRISASLNSNRSIIGQTVNLRNIPVVDPETGQTVIDPETGQPVVDQVESTSPSRSFNRHQMSISYNQTLFDFGRSFSQIKQAKAGFESASEGLQSTRHAVIATVKQRYLELLKAIKLEQEYREAVERSKEQLDRTQSMYEIGSVAQIDVYKQEVALGTDQINLINQRNIVDIARGNLNVAMGRDPETPIEIKDLDVLPSPPDFTLQDAMRIAVENNPDLRRFEFDMKSAEYGRKAAKGRYLPSIGLSLVYSRDNEKLRRVYGEFDKNFFIQVGASFDLNIFNGLADKAEVGRQTANYSIARENWLNRKRTLELEVKQAYLNLKASLEISKINEKNVRAAEEDFRLAQERYRVGAGTLLEVTDSQVSLTRARVNLVRTKYDAIIARAQLEAAMGVIDEELQKN